MAVNQAADFFLGGKPYMLMRTQEWRGRAWQRTGRSDAPGRRLESASRYGNLPDEIDHPEVFDDWSGGYGDAYRDPKYPNRLHWSENMDTRWPRQMVHCQQLRFIADTANSISINANHFIDAKYFQTPAVIQVGRGHLNAYVPADDSLLYAQTVEVTANYGEYVGRPAIFGSMIYLGWQVLTGTPGHGLVRYDAQNLLATQSNVLDGRAFVVAGNRLWRAFGALGKREGVHYLSSCAAGADPLATGNWSATLSVGDEDVEIRDMVALGGQVYLGVTDGLYAGDQSGTFYNVLSEIGNTRHPDNCRTLAIHNAAVVVPHVGGVIAYRPSSLEARAAEIGPSQTSNRSPVRGHVRALRASGQWLYAGLYTGSESYILAGRQGSDQSYIWNVMHRLPQPSKISRIHFDGITTVSGGGKPLPIRMYIATEASIDTGGTAPVYWSPVPLNNGNPLADDVAWSPKYVGSARADMPAMDWGAPSTPKVYRSVEVWADNLLSSYRYADLYYEVDSSGTRYLLGQANNSPKSTMYFPTQPATDELVLNPGFELAGPTADTWLDWVKATAAGTISDEAAIIHGGSHAIKVYCGHPVLHAESAQYNIPVDPNRWHTLSFWARGDGVNAGRYSLGRQAPANIVGTMSTGITAAAYAQVLASFRTAYPLVELHLMDPGVSGGYCYFDDVSMKRVAGGFVTGQSIALSLESFSASPAYTPVYRSIVLRGALRPKSVDTVSAGVRIADGVRDRQGRPMRQGATMLAELRGYAQSGTPQKLIDLAGATSWVAVMAPIDEQEAYQVGDENPEVAAVVKMAVLDFS